MNIKKVLALVTLIISIFSFSYSQSNFPEGSAQGITEMGSSIREAAIPNISLQITEPSSGREVAFSVRLLLLLTILTLAPSILILITCFLRFSIVLDFIKRALSLQQVPPTAVLNGIALFMTLFVMWPTFTKIYDNAYKPLAEGTLGLNEAIAEVEKPVREWMFVQLEDDAKKEGGYIGMFMSMAKLPAPSVPSDVPTYILIPAYILHELTVAFKIGVLLYIPFIIIDMVVASILMSMGMMMLPPVQISMPFKLILFVLVDGWGLLTQQLFVSVLH
ncbi:MAG: flagellar type III secretion system pore protein FliP [Treponema sp.]|nr:flagellar type III secretion system pore protein FliP [Treponema sp.]